MLRAKIQNVPVFLKNDLTKNNSATWYSTVQCQREKGYRYSK